MEHKMKRLSRPSIDSGEGGHKLQMTGIYVGYKQRRQYRVGGPYYATVFYSQVYLKNNNKLFLYYTIIYYSN